MNALKILELHFQQWYLPELLIALHFLFGVSVIALNFLLIRSRSLFVVR